MTATANIKVSKATRDQLAEVARGDPRGQVSMDKALQLLLAEHHALQRERTRKITENAELMAKIAAARAEPLEEGHSTDEVVAMLAERRRAEPAA